MRVCTVPPVLPVGSRESPQVPRGSPGEQGTARTLTAMNRLGTALLAAVEAIVTVGVGIGIALVPLTLLWGFEYGLQVDWDVFWKAAGSVWLVGHGVDVTFHLGAATAGASGIEGAGDPIHVTLAALGFAVVTAWLGGRAGRRFAETEHRTTGLLVGTAGVALLGLAIALSSTSAATEPVVWQAIVFPALWFVVPALVTAEVCRMRRGLPADPLTGRLLDQVGRVPVLWRTTAGFALRAGTAVTAVVVAAAGVVVALLLVTSFAEVIALYERSHAGVIGGIALTVGQLAFLPDLVGWAVAWLVGPGFAIGTGSNVSPIGTVLGPIPGIPVFGALPASGHTFGLLGVLVPVVAGFVVAGLMRPALVRALGSADSPLRRALAGAATGVVAGVLTGVATALTSGSLGPGRLTQAGPDGLLVGVFAALEVGVPAAVALAVGSDLVRLPERSRGRDRWIEADQDAADDARAGSLVAALDEAGAGRASASHRFTVEEAHDSSTRAAGSSSGAAGARRSRSPTPTPTPTPTQRTTVRASPPRRRNTSTSTSTSTSLSSPAAHPSRNRRRAAAGLGADRRGRRRAGRSRTGRPRPQRHQRTAGPAPRRRRRRPGARRRPARPCRRPPRPRRRDRHGQHGDDGPRPADETLPHAPGTEQQPAFPWSTEEFVAGRDDADEPSPATNGPASPATGGTRWDQTDQIAEDELPWWRRPKHDA